MLQIMLLWYVKKANILLLCHLKGTIMINKLDLRALFILFALISFVAVAQENNSDSNEEAEEEVIEEVITTGSHF